MEFDGIDRVVVDPWCVGYELAQFVQSFSLIKCGVLMEELLVVYMREFSGFVYEVFCFGVFRLGSGIGFLPS